MQRNRSTLVTFLLSAAIATALMVTGCTNNAATPAQKEGIPATTKEATKPTTKDTAKSPVHLLNVSYDPTRNLYAEFNPAFVKHWAEKTGQEVSVEPSHGGSGKQARSVIDGMAADVVTLALAFDIDAICDKSDLIAKDWQSRLPNNSAPYTSTIVFMVRKGNPKGIKDWNDLIKEDVEVVTPDPSTSGGARWNYLAAWAYVLKSALGDLAKLHDPSQAEAVAQAQAQAQDFVKELYAHVKVLDSGARQATLTFVENRRGDVFLAWENEAFYSINHMKNGKECEIVVPSISILAEPSVAVVDKVVEANGTREVAEAYLKYLYSPEGQAIVAKHYYRPRDAKAAAEEDLKRFSNVELFTVDDVFGGWQKAQAVHFDKGGTYDQISK